MISKNEFFSHIQNDISDTTKIMKYKDAKISQVENRMKVRYQKLSKDIYNTRTSFCHL